jgi:hypothetical protein
LGFLGIEEAAESQESPGNYQPEDERQHKEAISAQ